MSTRIEAADYADPIHASAIVELIDSYARGPGGQNAPLGEHAKSVMVRGLADHPMARVLLAFVDDAPVGIAVCVFGFSTFAGRPSLNVHDLAVHPDHQGRGVGRALLAEAERIARERDCCKLTLEVHDSNVGAKRLYRDVGFGPWDPATLFVTKAL